VAIIRIPKGNKESDEGDEEEGREDLDHCGTHHLLRASLLICSMEKCCLVVKSGYHSCSQIHWRVLTPSEAEVDARVQASDEHSRYVQ